MKNEQPVVQRFEFGIPLGPDGDDRRKVFGDIQQRFWHDPDFVQEHNTCASSEVNLRSVKFDVRDDDLTLTDTE